MNLLRTSDAARSANEEERRALFARRPAPAAATEEATVSETSAETVGAAKTQETTGKKTVAAVAEAQARRQQRRALYRRRAAMWTLVAAGALTLRWIDANQAPVFPLPAANGLSPETMAGPNAGHFYAAAADTLHGASDLLAPDMTTLSEQQDAVAQNTEALALLREGFHYAYQGDHTRWMKSEVPATLSAPGPNFVAQRTLARLLATDARVKATRGDFAGAMSASLDAVRFGQDIARGDHGLIGGMVGSLCEETGSAEGQRYVDSLSARDARAAARRLEAMQAREIRTTDMLQSEERFGLGTYQEIFNSSAAPPLLGQGGAPRAFDNLRYDALLLRYGRQGLVNNFTATI